MTRTIYQPQTETDRKLLEVVRTIGRQLSAIGDIYGVFVVGNDDGHTWIISPLSDEHCIELLASALEDAKKAMSQ